MNQWDKTSTPYKIILVVFNIQKHDYLIGQTFLKVSNEPNQSEVKNRTKLLLLTCHRQLFYIWSIFIYFPVKISLIQQQTLKWYPHLRKDRRWGRILNTRNNRVMCLRKYLSITYIIHANRYDHFNRYSSKVKESFVIK